MLIETKVDAAAESNRIKRWFADSAFDLTLWYDAADHRLVAFQLAYGKPRNERVLLWSEESGYRHRGVDDGESTRGQKQSPILVKDGDFDADAVADQFAYAAASIDPMIAETIAAHIRNARTKT